MGTKKLHYIMSLPEDKIAEVRQLIRKEGFSNAKIARRIQEEWGFHTDVVPATLTKAIQRYGKHMDKAALEHGLEKAGLLSRVADVTDKIDVIEEMADMALIQKGRVMKLYGKEAESPLLLGQVSAEIMKYHTILKDLAGVQLETGMLKRAPKTTTGVMQGQGPDGDPRVVQFRMTEETAQVLDAIDAEFEHVDTDGFDEGQELLTGTP